MSVQQMPARQQPSSKNDTHDLGRLFGRKAPPDDEQECRPEQQQSAALVVNTKSPAQAPHGQYKGNAQKQGFHRFVSKKAKPYERE